MKSKLTYLLAAMALCSYSFASAQGYDDDDIYYNPSKAKAAAKEQKTIKTTEADSYNSPVVTDFPSADTYSYSVGNGRNIDVDAYNRRYMGLADSTEKSQPSTASDFQYTQQIERFYNPQVIIESPDQDIASYYYQQPATDINIYVNTPGYWGSSFYSPYWTTSPYYYSSPWYWGSPRSWWYYNSWAYNPWYWDFGPSWSWGWGPSWSWGGYYPGYWGSAYYPHRPAWTYRPSGNNRPAYRPGSAAGVRPGSSYGSSYGNSRPSYRPGTSSASSPSYRPGQSGTTSGSGYRPGRSGSSRSSSSSSSPSYRPGSNSNSSTPSYRSSGSRSSSSSGFGGGSRGGSSSGGSRGGGGGRGRH